MKTGKLARFRQHRRIFAIAALAILIILTPLTIYIARTATSTQAAWWHEAWKYRKRIDFGNSGSTTTNEFVSFSVDTATPISERKMQTSCNDIRFTDKDGNKLEHRITYGDGVVFEDSSEFADTTSQSSFSWSHTVDSGSSDQLLVVVIHLMDGVAGSASVSTVTYNGDSMTNQEEHASADGAYDYVTSIWTLPNPDTGSNTVSVTLSESVGEQIASGMTFSGVDTTTPVGITATADDSGVSDLAVTGNTIYQNSLIVGGSLRQNTNLGTDAWDVRPVHFMPPGHETYSERSVGATDAETRFGAAGGFQYAHQPGSHTMTYDIVTNSNSDWNGAFIEIKPDRSTDCNTSTTDLEVAFPSISDGNNYAYMYYGNSTAPNQESTLADPSKNLTYVEGTPYTDTGGGDSYSFSHSVTSGDNQVLVVITNIIASQVDPRYTFGDSATYNGIEMVKSSLGENYSTNQNTEMEIWTLVNPPTGSNTFAITYDTPGTMTPDHFHAWAATYRYVAQDYNSISAYSYADLASTIDVDLTTLTPENLLVGGMWRNDGSNNYDISVDSPGTTRYYQATNRGTDYYVNSGGGDQEADEITDHTMTFSTASDIGTRLIANAIALEPDETYDEFTPTSGPTIGTEQYGTDGPIHYWQFNEVDGEITHDSIGRTHGMFSSDITSVNIDDDADLNDGDNDWDCRQLVRASNGDLYFSANDAGDDLSLYRSVDNGASWTEQDDTGSPDNTVVPTNAPMCMAIDSQDNLHIAWDDTFGSSEEEDVRYVKFDTHTQTFGDMELAIEVNKTNATDTWSVFGPAIAVDQNDIPHVVATNRLASPNSEEVVYANRIDGAWPGEENYVVIEDDTGGITNSLSAAIAINEDNIPEVIYMDSLTGGGIRVAVGDDNDPADGEWTIHEPVTGTTGDTGYDITIDAEGNTWIAYPAATTGYISLAKHSDGSAWTTGWTTYTDSDVGTHPSVTAVGTDIYVIYEEDSNDIVYNKYDGSSWDGESDPVLHAGTYGYNTVAWSQFNNHFNGVNLDYVYWDADDAFYDRIALTANPTWQSEDLCITGSCLQFDGTDDVATTSASVNNSYSNSSPDGINFSFWVKPLSDGENSTGKIFEKGPNTWCRTDSESGGLVDLECSLDLVTSDATLNITDALTIGTWHHVSMGWTSGANGDEFTIYIDGIDKGDSSDGSGGHANVINPIIFGGDESNNFHGFIDNFKIYAYERDEDEVKSDFAIGGAAGGSNAIIGVQNNDPLNQGLVGYWKMDESAANSCTGGTNDMCDSSRFGIDGAWQDNATNTSGKFGSGVTLDATDDYILVTDNDNLGMDANQDMTFSTWIKTNSNDDSFSIIEKGATSGSDDPGYWILVTDGQVDPRLGNTSGSRITTAGVATINDDQWHHVAVVYDRNADLTVYIDGEYDASNNISSLASVDNNTTDGFDIGARSTGTYTLDGDLDEMRVYNRALSPSEVSQLYKWAPGPIGYWPMDENTGTSITYDKSGNGYDGTLTSITEDSWVPGRFGSALELDGSADFIDVGTGPGQVNTVSFWVYPTTTTEYFVNLTSTTDYISASTGTVSATGLTSPTIYVNGVESSTIAAGEWSHVTVITDTSENASNLEIGRTADTNYLQGSIDEVKIYDYARTPSQVVEDMNGDHPLGGSPIGSAVAHWNLDDMSGTTAEDNSINDNSLTLSSASWTTDGKHSGAWNGTNAVWMSRADDSDFDISDTDDYSVGLWFRSDAAANPSATEYIFNKAASATAGYAIYANTSGQICFGIDDDTTWSPDVSSCTSTDFYDNTWHHLSAVRDTTAGETQIFIDGILRDSDTDSTSATLENSLSLYIGDRDGTDNGDEFVGDIDDIRVYRAALTQEQVNIVYNFGSSTNFGTGTNERDNITDGDYMDTLVGYWPLDENTGTSNTYEKSGNNLTSTLGGIAESAWQPGRYGSSLDFQDNDFVRNSSSPYITSATDALTVSGWIKPSTTYQVQRTIARHATSWWFYYNDFYDYLVLTITISSSNYEYESTVDLISFDEWNHVATSYDGDVVNFYVNGVLTDEVDAQNGSLDAGTNTNLYLGAANTTGYELLGTLDDLKVFNSVLTPAQIAYEYNRGAPIGWWQFDECQGTTAYDAGDGGNNGTITIGATGTHTSAGTCGSGTSTESWNAGTNGKFGASLNFDGTDDIVSIGDQEFMENTDFSITAWIKPNDMTADEGCILCRTDNNTTGDGIFLFEYWTDGSLTFISDIIGGAASTKKRTAASVLTEDVWQHVSVVYDDSADDASIYINGTLYPNSQSDDSLDDISANTGNDEITIGRRANNYDEFDGQIDDVRVYNYPLSADQIKQVMSHGAARFK